MGGEAHQFHAMDFLVYAYLQSGREAEARQVIEDARALPPMKMEGMDWDVRAFALSKFPAMYELELHHWSEAATLTAVAEAAPGDQAMTYWARAIGAARSGNLEQAKKDIHQLEVIHDQLLKQSKNYVAEQVDDGRQEAEAWLFHAEGHDEQAIAKLRALADKEDKVGDEPTAIPAREMLADMLLEMKRPEQALAEYKTNLRINPNRFNGLYGAARAAELAGKTGEATQYYAELVKVCAGGNSDRPELAKAKSLLAQK
jgi:tetratricopeptide (TPR) repeat protein